jgi:hypothetical protein
MPTDSVAEHRDKTAARVLDGEEKLSTKRLVWSPAEPLMAKWLTLESAYRYAVCQMPEAPSTACLDCGEPSLNGLTPCGQCIAQEVEASA